MNYWTIPKHVSYNMADVVMDFRFLCNNIWTDLIEEILYICNQDFEIIYVFIHILYYRKPEMST